MQTAPASDKEMVIKIYIMRENMQSIREQKQG